MQERYLLERPPRAFISYARKDGEEFTRRLRERIEREQPAITLWQDRTDMQPAAWWRQITDALDRVSFMILVLTPASVRSPVVWKEWHYARQQGVCIVPVKADSKLDLATVPRWMQKTQCYDLENEDEWRVFTRVLLSPPPAIRAPFMAPSLPDGFVERPREFDELRTLLLDRDRHEPVAATTALWGAGGLGKTTLAAALCHDEEVQAAFSDGILWATLGREPKLLDGLTKLYATLTGDRPAFCDVEDAAVHLAAKLEDRTCLIVIDDVWNPADLSPFRRAGKGSCAWLVTTRQMDVAVDAECVEVDTMAPDESLTLLTARLDPPPLDADLAPFHALARRLGGWPLLLELAGAALRIRIARRVPLKGALEYINQTLDKKGVGAFDRASPTERHQSMIQTIDLSAELLDPVERRHFEELAVFPEDTDVPLSAVGALWAAAEFETEEFVQHMANLSLLTLNLDPPPETLRLHDVMRAYLADRLIKRSIDPKSLHARLIDAWGDLHKLHDPYAWQWLAYHLVGAGTGEQLRTLLFDPSWLRAKLAATDPNALLADFEAFPGDPDLRLIHWAIRLSANFLAVDQGQLGSHLLGRLRPYKSPAIQEFLARLSRSALVPWFRPLSTSLTPPGGALLRTLAGYAEWVNAVAPAPDGRHAVSASSDRSLKVWDLKTGLAQLTLTGHADSVNAVAVARDGRRALSASSDRTLKLWDLEKGTALLTLAGHDGPVRAVAMAPGGRLAVSGSDDRTLKVWDLETGAAVLTLTGHADWVSAVVFAPDGRRAVSASNDTTLKVWDLEKGAAVFTLTGHADWVNAVAVAPDGRRALSASSDQTLKVWDLATGAVLLTLAGHAKSVIAAAIAPDGRRALSGSDDMTLKVWDLETGALLLTLAGHTGPVHAVAVAPDGRVGLSASSDTTLKVWDLETAAAPPTLAGHAGPVRAVAVAPDGRVALSASADATLKVWDLDKGAALFTLAGHTGPVHAAEVAPDGRRAISASSDMMLKVWDLEKGTALHTLTGHTRSVRAVAVSPDGRHAVSASADTTLKVWDLNTGICLRNLAHHTRPVRGVAVTADGRRAVSASDDTTLTVWDLEKGAALLTLTGHARPVRAVAVAPDGRSAISASSDGTLKVWALDTGHLLCTLAGHAGPVRSVAVSPDGRRAISASDDATLKVWDVDSGRNLASFPSEAPFLSVAVGPDGWTIVAGDSLGRVHFLRIEGI